jgi:endonuclease V-like protein UPF0215 family
MRGFSNVVGFDDAPFLRETFGAVPVVGAVFASRRLEGILVGHVERDGSDAAARLGSLISTSRFADHIQLVLLQGITMAGFNVVDVFELHDNLQVPVLVVSRKLPDMEGFRDALTTHIPGGFSRWAIVERLGPMEPIGPLYVQRVGIDRDQAAAVLRNLTMYGNIPEPLRTAHLVAGGLVEGQGRGSR